MKGILFKADFLKDSDALFEYLRDFTPWDDSMLARKTCSYGAAYNYSQMSYPYREFDHQISNLADQIKDTLGFAPNNCLINYYLNGRSKMGFHSDQTDILEENTGVAIVSLGATRILRFRNIENPENTKDFPLPAGSLIYMTNEVQERWKHAIPKSDTNDGRMSLTFRRIKL